MSTPPPLPPTGNYPASSGEPVAPNLRDALSSTRRTTHPTAFALGAAASWIGRPVALLGIIAACAVIGMAVYVGGKISHAGQQWDFKIEHFDREQASEMKDDLEILYSEGWEYVGPLCNDGINGRFVAFKRPKR